jgi:hypothetical protein
MANAIRFAIYLKNVDYYCEIVISNAPLPVMTNNIMENARGSPLVLS